MKMKIESFHHALPYFFTQQIRRKRPVYLLELEKGKTVPANILRWEDDGGRTLDRGNVVIRSTRERTDER